MTFDIEKGAPERIRDEAEQLHELAVNKFGYDTEHILFTAHGDGTISGQIALYVAGDYQDYEHDPEDPTEDDDMDRPSVNPRNGPVHNQDHDPDPPGVGVTVPNPSTDANTGTAEAGA